MRMSHFVWRRLSFDLPIGHGLGGVLGLGYFA